MNDKTTIEVRVSTYLVGSECSVEIEFDRAEWEAMSDDQREDFAREAMFEMIEWNWEEVFADPICKERT